MTHGEADPDEPSVGEFFLLRVRQQVVVLREQEPRVRRDEDDSVHKMRIAVRRLRSALSTYRPVLTPGATDALRGELRWLGVELSAARDAEVMRARLEDLVKEQPVELVMGPVAKRVDTEMSARYQAGRERALGSLDSPRYAELLSAVDALVAAPPFDERAAGTAHDELPRLLARELRRVERRADAAGRVTDPGLRGEALHETRKAAKRLRYAAESAVPAFGRRAQKLGKRAKRVQDVLGEHQDTVVARSTLRELGAMAYLEHENGFTFGRLHALEESRAGQLVVEYAEVVTRLPSRGQVKRWAKR